MVMAFMAAGTPLTFAEEGPMANPPDEEVIQQDDTIQTPSVYKEGFDTAGASVFGVTLLGLIALMAASDDGTSPTGHETPPAAHH